MQYPILDSKGQYQVLYVIKGVIGSTVKIGSMNGGIRRSIVSNLFKLITTLWLYKSFLILRKPTLKNLVVKVMMYAIYSQMVQKERERWGMLANEKGKGTKY